LGLKVEGGIMNIDGKKFVMAYVILVISLIIILTIAFIIINSVYGFSAFVLSIIFITIVIIAVIIGFTIFILLYYGITKDSVVQNARYSNNYNEKYHRQIRSQLPSQAPPLYSLDDIIDDKNSDRKF
jgi:hypothetical protein